MSNTETTPVSASPDIDLACPACGYDLRATESERCPECGVAVDRASLLLSQIPWVHRQRIGRVRAHVKTAWLGTFHLGRLVRELGRPVDYRDAQRFRLVTALLVALPLSASLLIGYIVAGGTGFLNPLVSAFDVVPDTPVSVPLSSTDLLLPWAVGATLWPVLPLCMVLFVVFVTGIPSYWFHPRSITVHRQNRAVALSYYATGLLVWQPPLLLCAVALGFISSGGLGSADGNGPLEVASVVLGIVAIYAIPVLLWLNLLRLLAAATSRDWLRITFAAVGIPLAAAACAAIVFGFVPWVVGFVWLMVDSLL